MQCIKIPRNIFIARFATHTHAKWPSINNVKTAIIKKFEMHSEENLISWATILLLLFCFLLVPGRLHSGQSEWNQSPWRVHTSFIIISWVIHLNSSLDFKDYGKKKKRRLPDDSTPSMESKERRKWAYETSSLGHFSLMLLNIHSNVFW